MTRSGLVAGGCQGARVPNPTPRDSVLWVSLTGARLATEQEVAQAEVMRLRAAQPPERDEHRGRGHERERG